MPDPPGLPGVSRIQLNYTNINKLCKEINSQIGLICRIKRFLPENTVNTVYKALIKPKLEYGCIIFGFTYRNHFEKLIKLQKRAARIITNSGFTDSSTELFPKLKWRSFENQVKYQSLIYIYKSINGIGSKFHKIFLS